MAHRSAARGLAAMFFLGLAALPLDATAQPPSTSEAVFDGTGRAGNASRAVRFRFMCTPNGGPGINGVLSVALEIPRPEQWRGGFDFAPFAGPDATAGALSHLRANGVRSKAGNRFAAAGSTPSTGAYAAFVFEIAMSRRDPAGLGRLATVLRPLMDGPGQLVWRQGNAKREEAPIDASLELLPERAERLKAVLGPCLAR